MFNQPSTNEENPNPNPAPFFFPFSNPLLTQNNDSLDTHFVPQPLQTFENLNTTKGKPLKTRRKRNTDYKNNPNLNQKPRKRSGKSDRHSKIFTAQGPRDRRMRLSVHIARKFFDLQDMLGFDKASNTIEWLFSQSRDAIRELSITNGPDTSINQSSLSNYGNCFEMGHNTSIDGDLGNVGHVSQAKEPMDKARTRARERTREKMIIGIQEESKGEGIFEGNPKLFEDLGFLRSLGEETNFPLEEVMIDKYVGAPSSSASNSIYDFDNDFSTSIGVDSSNSFMGIFGNWDMMLPFTGNAVHELNPSSSV